MKPYVIRPHSRRANRTRDNKLEILIGGSFSFWENSIKVDGKFIEPVSIERVTNTRGGNHPFTLIVISGIELGRHSIQIDNDQPIIFYTNPLY